MDQVAHLARSSVRGVVERYRYLGRSGVAHVFGKNAAADYLQRQRADRREQAAQETSAHPDI
jgi:hypothetical protein